MKSLLVIPADNGYTVTCNYEEERDEKGKILVPERKEKRVFESRMDMLRWLAPKIGFECDHGAPGQVRLTEIRQ